MQLKSLDIENFRCHETCHIDFNDRLTVIVGANGAGKTSILEATRIAIASYTAAMKVITKIDNKRLDSIQNEDVRNKWIEAGSVTDVQPQYPSRITVVGDVDGNETTWKRSKTSKDRYHTLSESKEITDVAKGYLNRLKKGDKSLVLPMVAYYGTGRLWRLRRDTKKNFAKKNSRTDGYVDALDGTANGNLLQRWFYNMANTEFQREESIPEYHAVRKAMGEFFNQITGNDNSKVIYNRFEQGIDFIYEENGCKEHIPLRLMSDGYRCSISLVTDIAYRMAILNPDLFENVITETSGIVLIDEVDLHLHPSWQQRILGILLSIFPKVQFIVSSHAPSVINSVQQENIRILTDEGIKTAPVEVYGKDVNGILQTIMESTTRPSEVLQMFKNFHKSMDDSDYVGAENILGDIAAKIGEHDPELVAARVELDFEQSL